MAVGGDLLDIKIEHPDLGSARLYYKAAEDHTFNPGGFTTADEDNGIDGSGAGIYIMNRERWSAEGTISWDDNERDDWSKLRPMRNSPKECTITISRANGSVYKGSGRILGQINGEGNNATISLKVGGGGELEQIAGN